LHNTFELLINSYIEIKVGIVNEFLSSSLTAGLKENLIALHKSKQLHAAGTGNFQVNNTDLFRSDIIHWLDRKHDDPRENEFFLLMDNFISHLNSTCYTGINDYEFHYTVYPIGSSYKKHLDQFKSNDSRKYSMIMYLNDDWKKEDGGALQIFLPNERLNIFPESGKSVFFKSSELEHEVLQTHKPRLSITGWLKTV
jgi:SM-20-related protein